MRKTLTTSLIVCDRCGTELAAVAGEDATTARIRAVEADWRYMRYGPERIPIVTGTGRTLRTKKIFAPASGDFCPECPVPSTEEWGAIALKRYEDRQPPYDHQRSRLPEATP